jgi:hypothetical protein
MSSNLIFKGFRYENLYLVDFDASEAKLSTCLLIKSSMGWLWHRRLGHVGIKQLNNIVKHDLVRGLKNITFENITLVRGLNNILKHDLEACMLSRKASGQHSSKEEHNEHIKDI